jgi:hypothetical protein
METLKFTYSETSQLIDVINENYIENNGRLKLKKPLEIPNNNLYYTILSGLNMKVKLKSDNIDGTMLFNVVEEKEKIKLYPENLFCVVENGKYSFY